MNVLVAIDFSNSTQPLLRAVRTLTQNHKTEHQIWLLHVAEPDPDFIGFDAGPESVRNAMADRYHREHRELQSLAEALRGEGFESTALLIQGSTVETILEQAQRLKLDLIVAGTHGHGQLYDALLGSTSTRLVRHSDTPVLLVPLKDQTAKFE